MATVLKHHLTNMSYNSHNTRCNVDAKIPTDEAFPPPPEMTDVEAEDEYLLMAAHNLSVVSSGGEGEGEGEGILHSSSDSSVPHSLSVSRFGVSHSGVFTGHSSATSWDMDDEFDQASTNNVREVLDQIFSALYGDIPLESEELEDECAQWSGTFPHMRVVGQQILDDLGDGTEEILMDTPPATAQYRPRERLPVTPVETTCVIDLKSLSVAGSHIQPVAVYCDHKELNDECSTIEEEILASDGVVEEYIVFDNAQEEAEGHFSPYRRSQRHHRLGLPPVTPNACVRDTVCSQVFDQIWAEAVPVLQPLLAHMKDIQKRDRHHSFIHAQDSPESAPHPPLTALDPQPHMFPSLRDQPTLMRATGQFGSQPLRLKPPPPPLSLPTRDCPPPPPNPLELQNAMQIRPLQLQKRSSLTSALSPSEIWENVQRETSLSYRHSKVSPLVAKFSDHQLISTRLVSGKNKRTILLKPLDKPKTPAPIFDDFSGLRGQKLSTHNEFGTSPPGLMQSPIPWVKNTQLPPLEDSGEKRLASPSRNNIVSSRISSASPGNRSNADIQKHLPVFVYESRPNTSYTLGMYYRIETPKSIIRRGSNHSVSNTTLNAPPSRAKMLGVGVVGRATGHHGTEFRDRYDDDGETILEEEDDDLADLDWKGPLYISPFWSKPRTNVAGIMKYRGPMR